MKPPPSAKATWVHFLVAAAGLALAMALLGAGIRSSAEDHLWLFDQISSRTGLFISAPRLVDIAWAVAVFGFLYAYSRVAVVVLKRFGLPWRT